MRDEEASMWSSRRGRRVEAGGRYGLMEAGVCEREWWRRVSESGVGKVGFLFFIFQLVSV